MRGSGNLDCEWSERLGEKPGEYQFKLSFLPHREYMVLMTQLPLFPSHLV